MHCPVFPGSFANLSQARQFCELLGGLVLIAVDIAVATSILQHTATSLSS